MMTPMRALEGDITSMRVDAIVNAANRSLLGGGGVDGAIHRVGGPSIREECRSLGGCEPGHAVITGAGNLRARWVVHTVGPIWSGDDPEGQSATLASCYRESLALAAAHRATSIAFPNISTGVYRFPKERAAAIATSATREWLATEQHTFTDVVFVCFDTGNLALYEAILSS